MKNLGLLSELAVSRVRSVLGATATLDVELDPRLADHTRYLEKHVAELRTAAERALTRHRREIVDRQLVVERLANMAIELFATACVISRTQALITTSDAATATRSLALCDLFAVEAGRRFRAAREGLSGRDDAVDDTRRAVAASVRHDGGYALPDAILGGPAEVPARR
jgi:acyl-CoA dehydrogenase family protein 9